MEGVNRTTAGDFLIVGFLDYPQLQIPLFVTFLLMYMATLAGNLLIMAIVCCNSRLHTPMYFFLTNLSMFDIIYTTNIFPKMLVQFFLENKHISFTECLLQMYFFMAMVFAEFSLLAVMAYDRYVAICNPLCYIIIMNKAMCVKLATGTWVFSFIYALPHTILISGLSFCESHQINHFFCDVTALMKLSCTSTHTFETMTYIMGVIVGFAPFSLILTSYINIISTILKIQTAKGRHKAFSTCASHLTVVILFYGTICSMYMRPTSTYSMDNNKILSLSYIVVTPLCNPIIYSLKNTEFKNALHKTKNPS